MAGRVSQARFDELVASEFAAQPLAAAGPLREEDLAPLPPPVQRYVRASGTVGKPRPRNVRLEFEAVMRRKPGDAGMSATSVQFNFFVRPARLFLMKARMYGLPVRALHVYRAGQATFQVRVASLVDMIDQSGEQISRAETVTVLNDLCAFAPGALVDERLAWRPIDDRSAAATFTNGTQQVSATLIFGADDQLVDFWSDDRPDTSSGKPVPMRWSTPLGGYQVFDGIRVPTQGSTVYARPEGPFTYGEFTLRSIAWNIASPDGPSRSR